MAQEKRISVLIFALSKSGGETSPRLGTRTSRHSQEALFQPFVSNSGRNQYHVEYVATNL